LTRSDQPGDPHHEDKISCERRWRIADGNCAHPHLRRRHDPRARAQRRPGTAELALHHGNFQGHRFSALKEINTDTAKNLKLAFTVALGASKGAGTRFKFGNLEATPLIEDGSMTCGRLGTVYAIGRLPGQKRHHQWRMIRNQQSLAGDVACCGVNKPRASRSGRKGNLGHARWSLIATNKATGEKSGNARSRSAIRENIDVAPLIVRNVAIVGTAARIGIRGFIDGTTSIPGRVSGDLYDPGRGRTRNRLEGRQDRWKHGGAFGLETATYDPETDTFYRASVMRR